MNVWPKIPLTELPLWWRMWTRITRNVYFMARNNCFVKHEVAEEHSDLNSSIILNRNLAKGALSNKIIKI